MEFNKRSGAFERGIIDKLGGGHFIGMNKSNKWRQYSICEVYAKLSECQLKGPMYVMRIILTPNKHEVRAIKSPFHSREFCVPLLD